MSIAPSTPPRLRPLGFGEILDVSFKICTGKAATLLKAVCITVVPLQIVAALVVISTIGDEVYSTSLDTTTTSEEEIDVEWTEIAGFGVLALLGGLTYLLSIGACFRAIAQAYMGHAVDWRGSVRFAVERLGSLLWVCVLAGAVLAAGVLGIVILAALASLTGVVGILLAVALAIAGVAAFVWISTAWSFAFPALFVEDVRGIAALKRSFGLVQGAWWRVFGVLFVGYLIASVIALVVQMIIVMPVFVGVDEETIAGVTLNVSSTIVGQLVSTPLVSAIVAVVYFDQRVRREGLDLELLAQQIGEQGAPVGPAPAAPPGFAPGPYAPGPFAPAPPAGGAPAWPAPPGNPPPPAAWPPQPPAPRFVKHPVPPQPPPDGFAPPTAPPPRHPDDPPPPDFLPPRPPEPRGDR